MNSVIPLISGYKYKLTGNSSLRLVPGDAYRLYTWLLNGISEEYGDELHQEGEKPVSQYIYFDKDSGTYIWAVNLLSYDANSAFSPILKDTLSVLIGDETVTAEKIAFVSYASAEEFIKESRKRELPVRLDLIVHSTLSFKQNGNYCIYPQIDLMIHSLVSKWNTAFPEYVIDDEDAVLALVNGLYISGYALHTNRFSIKGTGIPGCVGKLQINSKLSAPIFELWKSLICFGAFSGAGIKTTLGMGGIEIRDIEIK